MRDVSATTRPRGDFLLAIIPLLRLANHVFNSSTLPNARAIYELSEPLLLRNLKKKKKKTLVRSPKLGSTPRHTDWLTVSCKVTLTLTLLLITQKGLSIRWTSQNVPRSPLLKAGVSHECRLVKSCWCSHSVCVFACWYKTVKHDDSREHVIWYGEKGL
jgi:hypothetical protein